MMMVTRMLAAAVTAISLHSFHLLFQWAQCHPFDVYRNGTCGRFRAECLASSFVYFYLRSMNFGMDHGD